MTIDLRLGRWSCYLVVVLALAYVPVLIVGLAAAEPGAAVPDPYQAIMELLLIPSVLATVLIFAIVHSATRPERRSLSAAALIMVSLAAAITTCVHAVLLSVGRSADATTLPGYDILLSWQWPSVVYALDIVAWDVFFGVGLLLAAAVLTGWTARLLVVGGVLCLGGIWGAVIGDMTVRDVGIVGYAVVFPAAMWLLARCFDAQLRSVPTE